MIKRKGFDIIQDKLEPSKALIVYGPRRVGKTTLLKEVIQTFTDRYYFGTGDDRVLADILETESVTTITEYFRNYDLIVIDEAQRISNIGQALKIMVDHIPNAQIIATGSASFELSNKVGEPLVGRNKELLLYPLSVGELNDEFGAVGSHSRLEQFLVYGMYPEVITKGNYDEKAEYLDLLVEAYLYRDILELENIRNAQKIKDLLTLIAFQVGYEVSLNELGESLGLSKQTVERYLDLLEKSFVIKNVRGFSRNLRKEVTKTSRYYFWDNGVLNALKNNFNLISQRNDVGQLWENFMVMERMKRNAYAGRRANYYFWRTYDQKEVDLVEEIGGKLYGFEFKWGTKKVKPPALWLDTYPEATFEIINPENYQSFLAT